jgi:hypothetical protein
VIQKEGRPLIVAICVASCFHYCVRITRYLLQSFVRGVLVGVTWPFLGLLMVWMLLATLPNFVVGPSLGQLVVLNVASRLLSACWPFFDSSSCCPCLGQCSSHIVWPTLLRALVLGWHLWLPFPVWPAFCWRDLHADETCMHVSSYLCLCIPSIQRDLICFRSC